MLLVRTEPRGPALVELLSEAGSRGLLGYLSAVPGSPADLRADGARVGTVDSTERETLDAPSIIRFHLDDAGIRVLSTVIGDGLFADAGRGGEEALRLASEDGYEWVACVFADRQAVVNETEASWLEVVARRPALSSIVVGPLGADLMAEPAAERLVDELVGLDEPAAMSRIHLAMTEVVGGYDTHAAALGAAILTVEGTYPESVGSLAWLPIGSPPEGIGTLVEVAAGVFRRVGGSRRWQSQWRDVGLLDDALAELSWYLKAIDQRRA